MNVSDLHSNLWLQLVARRAQLPHALLISGQRGIGKTDIARNFAEFLLCENPTANFRACTLCPACTWLAQGNHPDFRLLQPDALTEEEGGDTESGNKRKPSQQITIDQVRDLDDFLHIGTHRHGVRVVLVNPAESMNRATANSLLKSLEEPMKGTLFLLVSSEPERLLPTIRSRCQSFAVPLPDQKQAKAWLSQAGISDAGHWLALAGGSPLIALELGQSEERVLLDALIAEMSLGIRMSPLLAATRVDRAIKTEKRPAPLKRMIEWAQKWLYDLTLASKGLPLRYFISQEQQLQQLAKSSNPLNVLALYRKTIQYKLQCEQPLNSRLFLEDFFLSYAALFETP